MPKYKNMYPVDLANGEARRVNIGTIYQGDSYANRIGAIVTENGLPVSLGGSCHGKLVFTIDDETVPLENGIIDGNKAYCDLIPTCYDSEGPVEIHIKWTNGTEMAELLFASGYLKKTETDTIVDPSGHITLSVETLINDIAEAEATIPEDYSILSNHVDALTHIDLTDSGYVNGSGAEVANSDYRRTGYIPIASDSFLVLDGFFVGSTSGSAYAYYFYTADKTPISGANGITTKTVVSVIPQTAAYVRFSSRISNGEHPVAYVSNHVVQDTLDLKDRTEVVEDDVADLKSAVPLLTDYSLGGEHTITADELETGTWIYTGKSDNSKRLRNKTLFPIKKGMKVQYSNPTMKIIIIVVASMPTSGWDQSSGWINAGSSGEVTATLDGYLIVICESTNDITAADYDCSVKILTVESAGLEQTDKALSAVENLGALPVDFGWLQSTDIWPDYGTDRDSRPTRSRSGYILLPKGASLTVTPSPWYIQWYRYNAQTKAWIDKSAFTASWTNAAFTLHNTDADYYYRFVVRDANADANVTASEITVTGALYLPIVSQVKTNTTDISALKSYHAAAFVTPTNLRICGGIEQNIYYQNILSGFDAKRAYEIKTTTYATNFNDFARISKADSTSETHGFRFNLYRFNSSYLESKTLNYQIVPKSSGSGLSKKVLIIGDSLTYNQPLTKHLVDNLLTSDAMTVQLIGTLGTAPYLREGRSGWGAYTYTHEATHTNESGTTFTNAFWNPSTSAFDFSYYMEQNDFSGVDYVFICLGTNDFGRTDVAANLQTMITSIHTYSSNIRIGVWTPPPRGLTGNGSLVNRDTLLSIVNAILTAFEGQETNKVYTVPVTLNVDPYHDFPMDSVNVSADNTSYQMLVTTDKAHPSNAGYAKMADMIYSYIKYFGYLDAQ